MSIALLTYADGPAVYSSNQRALARSARRMGIEQIKLLGPANLPEPFRSANRAVLGQAEGAGYWLWKPRIILDALEAAPDNEIIIYIDSGATLRRPLDVLIAEANEHDGVFFWNDYSNWMHVKRDCFILTGTDNDFYHGGRQLDAALILVRNSARMRAFVRLWLDACSDPRILTDQPNLCGEPDLPGFVAHRHDQSVLSVLFLRERSQLDLKLYARRVKHRFIRHHRRRIRWLPIWVWEATHDGAERFWSRITRRCRLIFGLSRLPTGKH